MKWITFGLLISGLLAVSVSLSAKPGGRFDSTVDSINAEEGKEIIEDLRLLRLRGDYVFYFDLENLPRRGPKSKYEGVVLGTWNPDGPLTRAIIWEPGRRDNPLLQIIAQSGPDPKVWVWRADTNTVTELTESQYFEPLLPGNHYTAFDLLMPFIFWEDYTYEGSKRVKGSPMHQFVMHPPQSIRNANPEIGGAMISVDTRFKYVTKAELLDPAGEELQTIEIQDLAKVDGQYIIKQIDFMDEISRDKSRFLVVAAAVDMWVEPEIFDPERFDYIPDLTGLPFKGV